MINPVELFYQLRVEKLEKDFKKYIRGVKISPPYIRNDMVIKTNEFLSLMSKEMIELLKKEEDERYLQFEWFIYRNVYGWNYDG